MKYLFIKISIFVSLFFVSCNHDSWLERDPQNIITDEQLWNDPKLIKSILANYYDRLPSLHGVFNTGGMSELDDAMWSGHHDQNGRNDFQYGDDYGRYWDYGFIRDLNLALENIDKYSVSIDEGQKNLFKSELRYIRASVYFELVKRMGGVPLVTKQLIYDFSGDPTPLQVARSKEYEVYDFIYTELEEIKSLLADNNDSQTRANTYTALALESRAMLYAASIAKYNNLMASPITTPGGEIGIPADKANDYYTKSLNASKAIISDSRYKLYNENADKGANFYDMLNKKGSSEVIFAKDFKVSLKIHFFAYDNIVKSITEDNEGSSTLSPSLSLVESFDYLDGSKGTIHNKDAKGNYTIYDNISDVFKNKDARLYGTVVYAGTSFKGTPVNIQAGVAVWENGSYRLSVSPNLGAKYTDNGLWTGFDGPVDNEQFVSNTGFYLRKLVSDASAASTRGTAAENWWPWFRLGEIYLNAAEAAFELQQADAKNYINTLRVRAGFPENSITTLTTDIIRNERRVELAFEDHRYFDLKRWRIAHEVWNGSDTSEDAVVHGLYPYRIVNPGHEDNNKYVFEKIRPNRFKRARFFRMANYYSSIDQNVLNNNPKLVKNPFH
ncbi:putative outer membrane starch-binding protein [Dysgonomonas alginatilytica]|uniref:Putative outer membrane starch-binding protein n=1 Tax=Dysgonomonas alginatilytica TaxID=1605892 RepID=A0A2V3PTU8_9BACT|nr:RagB/SusD family nutrient uptake outer membrane protein [Dysgonomonas alginatilytica]PXV66359.1 putative outer membrane starch-binding protein [Dysgonomonas alginatilytica]